MIHSIVEALSPRAVAARIEARQRCVELRGARASGRFEVPVWRGGEDGALVAASRG